MNYSLNIKGHLFSLNQPCVMGILNVTPDSFFAASRQQTEMGIGERVRQIVAEGGTIIDVGACSTRPGAAFASQEEEMNRLRMALPIIRQELDQLARQAGTPLLALSVDTFRPDVARMAVEEFGADIINDVSEGSDAMFRMTSRLGTPYILMSVQPDLRSTLLTFARKVQQLRDLGQKDIILDPGFGFGKATVGQPADCSKNFALLNELEKLSVLNLPLLVGVSRKSLIYKTLNCTPEQALNGTTVLNTIALMKGASILRVHDVKAASECCQLFSHLSLPDCPCSSNLE
jgi:dihydropteroate synthase